MYYLTVLNNWHVGGDWQSMEHSKGATKALVDVVK